MTTTIPSITKMMKSMTIPPKTGTKTTAEPDPLMDSANPHPLLNPMATPLQAAPIRELPFGPIPTADLPATHPRIRRFGRERGRPPEPKLTFSPLAWLKLQFLCHAGPTEVAAFGLSAPGDLLRLDDVLVVKQRACPASVAFDDAAVADLFDAMADLGVPPAQFARIWLHTHPGASVEPSGTDEETFARGFGACDWAVMAILGRMGRVSARLTFGAGPGGSLDLASAVDWAAWPLVASALAAAAECLVLSRWAASAAG